MPGLAHLFAAVFYQNNSRLTLSALKSSRLIFKSAMNV